MTSDCGYAQCGGTAEDVVGILPLTGGGGGAAMLAAAAILMCVVGLVVVILATAMNGRADD